MGATLIGHFDVGSPDWHAARAHGLGGSEIAPVLGLSPYESRFSLWHRKVGAVGPVEETSVMEWGKRLEPAVLAKFLDNHPELDGRIAGTWRHDERPWQIANPDMLLDGEIAEVKTARFDDEWGEPGTDQIPIWYRVQCIWYLDVFGLERCHVPVLIGGSDYREYLITYDETEAEQLRAAAVEFLATIERRERPDIDAHAQTYQVLKELHPDIESVDVELDNDTARRFIAARARLGEAAEAEQYARSLVADAMGSAHRALWDGRTIATRQARDGGVPYVVTGRNLPDLTATPNPKEAAA